jgi:Xaa-Pro aminopeptidase
MNGLDMMRPGVPFNEAIMAFRKPVQKAGMDYLELGIHGHGLSSGEFPTALYPEDRIKYLQITSSKDKKVLAPVSSFPFQENMVFGMNVDIHNPKWMKNVGVMLGDTVVIKETGPQLLCQTPVKLNII